MSQYDQTTVAELQSYLTFNLADENFAVNVLKVIEILEIPKITRVPKAPDFLIGVINLRGNVLPVIDARIKFGLEPTETTVNTCIIVMNLEIEGEDLVLGALVDAVDEVLDITPENIKGSPSIGSQYNPEFIEGVAKVNDEFVMILNIGKVFSTEDVKTLKDVKPDMAETKTKTKTKAKTDSKAK
ncbi:MAG: chemotaxis protein CheW [Cyclobacteriaceae bacterium]|nr:chemotaxis protein CheW [Cyclobacteriaceae bacterium]